VDCVQGGVEAGAIVKNRFGAISQTGSPRPSSGSGATRNQLARMAAMLKIGIRRRRLANEGTACTADLQIHSGRKLRRAKGLAAVSWGPTGRSPWVLENDRMSGLRPIAEDE